MGNVQISQELFMQLLRFHLVEDGSCEKEIKQGLEKNWTEWSCVTCMENLKLLRQRKNGTGEKRVSGQTWSAGEFPMVILPW